MSVSKQVTQNLHWIFIFEIIKLCTDLFLQFFKIFKMQFDISVVVSTVMGATVITSSSSNCLVDFGSPGTCGTVFFNAGK